MSRLKDILYEVRILDVVGDTSIAVKSMQFDSREVNAGAAFVALNGTVVDGHEFIDKALALGATTIVCEKLPEHLKEGVTYVTVRSSHEALGIMASNFYDRPSTKLKLVGITGTNGKTTTATILYHTFTKLGHKVGLISTVENIVGDTKIPSTHTTPDPVTLNKLLSEMVEQDCSHCFMEVSSHAVVQGRIDGLEFCGGVFTNITHEHLDYHGTFDGYIAAKKMFFDKLPKHAFALVNNDDPRGSVMVQNTKAKAYTFGLKGMADFKTKILENVFTGLVLNIDGDELYSQLLGKFNAYNVLGVFAVAKLLNEEHLEILTAISMIDSVEGRFQAFNSKTGVIGIVDYAHTPDALKNVLQTIQEIRTGNETVITIAGCGGDRDKAKRPQMASIACEYSDKVIFTSDNPRTEDPRAILEDMKVGVPAQHFKKYVVIEDRAEAIKMACSIALPGDIVMIAGKGHEKYQEINGIKNAFDDVQILVETFKSFDK
jgi:UDP-N-acetylmuramoyl-L-alanyl-D-glutamate--2,6-diaminopimelate ligase